MKNKIGVGIITYNRPDFFKSCIESISGVDKIVVVNDGEPYGDIYPSKINKIIQHPRNMGISKTKNDALTYLMQEECEHIFLCEDDIAVGEPEIFYKYIRASEISGICHFNYAYHGPINKDALGNPTYKKLIQYGDNSRIIFTKNITGAFSYYRKGVLESVGLMDENYRNVIEHVDHTYQIIKAGFHPSFRWFADIENSYSFIKELDPNLVRSTNMKNILFFKLRVRYFEHYFKLKNGIKLQDIKDIDQSTFLSELKEIQENFGIRSTINIV